jgi:hypothetical protein
MARMVMIEKTMIQEVGNLDGAHDFGKEIDIQIDFASRQIYIIGPLE